MGGVPQAEHMSEFVERDGPDSAARHAVGSKLDAEAGAVRDACRALACVGNAGGVRGGDEPVALCDLDAADTLEVHVPLVDGPEDRGSFLQRESGIDRQLDLLGARGRTESKQTNQTRAKALESHGEVLLSRGSPSAGDAGPAFEAAASVLGAGTGLLSGLTPNISPTLNNGPAS